MLCAQHMIEHPSATVLHTHCTPSIPDPSPVLPTIHPLCSTSPFHLPSPQAGVDLPGLRTVRRTDP
ncbi:unnamed protein product, partial [Closterium sp. NIES-54]